MQTEVMQTQTLTRVNNLGGASKHVHSLEYIYLYDTYTYTYRYTYADECIPCVCVYVSKYCLYTELIHIHMHTHTYTYGHKHKHIHTHTHISTVLEAILNRIAEGIYIHICTYIHTQHTYINSAGGDSQSHS